ncbi:MAG TPA: exodeoxyribonuclease VII small subunit [Anaerolineales bacterium]
MKSETYPPVTQLTYEQAFAELEQIVTALESDESALDNALKLFERGQELAHYCASLLDQAELKVQQISGEELIPFSPEE